MYYYIKYFSKIFVTFSTLLVHYVVYYNASQEMYICPCSPLIKKDFWLSFYYYNDSCYISVSIWMKTRLLLVICTEGLKLTFISIQNGSIQRGSFLIWAWIRLQIGNDSKKKRYYTMGIIVYSTAKKFERKEKCTMR